MGRDIISCSMSYAVIQLQGKQHIVSAGDTLIVDRLDESGKVTITDVLLYVDGDTVQVGTPTLPGAKVVAEVEKQQRGDKLVVFKYKSKSKYRKTRGHRQEQTVLKISSISVK